MPLEDELTQELYRLNSEIKLEIGYDPSKFRKMIDNHGGLEAVKRLINSPNVSEGFIKLLNHNRLDLSIESLILKEEWSSLFTENELSEARRRLNR